MEQTLENKNKAIVLGAFDTLFNSRRAPVSSQGPFWQPDQMRADNPLAAPGL